MSGTKAGAEKMAARRIGLPVEEYRRQRESGARWCTGCAEWHPVTAFGKGGAHRDAAFECRVARRRRLRKKRGDKWGQRNFPDRLKDPVSGDKRQARERIHTLIRRGTLKRAQDRPCTDCGHTGADRVHHYDHHLGYKAEHHEHVEPVCSQCHYDRSVARGERRRGWR